ncbi:hypothetical protein FGO68_gene7721 [Halteria grandinella]|uniref:Uncharacterized protein n=1 Tax=Halteria grandinella TaxID=5974 RepID=A0A8J8NC24_HALGN|nr:hypothetical protein FGO68_gene7721 [Halteria grandinella]
MYQLSSFKAGPESTTQFSLTSDKSLQFITGGTTKGSALASSSMRLEQDYRSLLQASWSTKSESRKFQELRSSNSAYRAYRRDALP